MKIGLIGLGYWGNIYAKTLRKMDIEFDACTRDYEELILKNSEIEAVIIATPPETHYQIILNSIKYDKHILCEKPFTTNSEDGVNLLKIPFNKKIMVGHIYIYHPAIQKMKEILRESGPIKWVEAKRLGGFSNKNSMWELGSHDLYILDYLLFESAGHIMNNSKDSRKQKALIDYGDFDAIIENSTIQEKKIRELNIVTRDHLLFFNDQSDNKLIVSERKKNSIDRIDIDMSVSPLERQIYHFIDCIKNDSTPLSDGFAGLRNVKMLEKCSII